MDIGQFLETFYEECDDHLSLLESSVLALEQSPSDKKLLNAIFRAVHSIKGGAASFHLPETASFSHSLEELLDRMRKGTVAIRPEGISLILEAGDSIKRQLAANRGAGTIDPSVAAGIIEKIKSYTAASLITLSTVDTISSRPVEAQAERQDIPVDGLSRANRFKVAYRPNPLCLNRGEDPLAVLQALSEKVTVESLDVKCDDLPPLQQFSTDITYLWWEVTICSDLSQDALRRVLAGMVGGSLEINRLTPEARDAGTVTTPVAHTASLLGTILIEEGMVTEERLVQALCKQTPDTRLGEVLVEGGAITTEQLDRTLEKQKVIARDYDSSSVRVRAGKIDTLVDLTGELVIMYASLGNVSDMNALKPGLGYALTRLGRSTRDILDSAIALRMLPVGNVFNQFPRLVRDMAAECGKKATILITGENMELGKIIIEKIGAPLTHLIRNAVDHGIETPEIRVQHGKQPVGIIKLRASEAAGGILISVEDDGRGFDRAAILRKAQAVGLIDQEMTPADLTDQQIYSLIFQPGFSTAATVSSISGRGVGLDVVKTEIEALGGSVGVESTPGLFTRFYLRLPSNVVIVKGQLVRVADEIYVIPLAPIIDLRRPEASDVRTLNGEEEVLWGDEYVPLVRLYKLLGGKARETGPGNAFIVIVESAGRRCALLVDYLLELRQMIMKGLGDILPKAPGIAGATILSDGKIAFVLDISSIMDMGLRGGGKDA